MITPEQRTVIIALRLEQAERCTADAELSLLNGRLEMATNRVYYGMFYAMLALGALRQFETSKHMQLLGWFNKNFVHTGLLPSSFGRMAKRAYEKGQAPITN